MTLLFFSTDDCEVQEAAQSLLQEGIPCEIRQFRSSDGMHARPLETELWLRNARDCNRALRLFVELGIGFAKRATMKAKLAVADFRPSRCNRDTVQGHFIVHEFTPGLLKNIPVVDEVR